MTPASTCWTYIDMLEDQHPEGITDKNNMLGVNELKLLHQSGSKKFREEKEFFSSRG